MLAITPRFFTPRELFTYVVIITLLILILGQIIHWMVRISVSAIVIDVTSIVNSPLYILLLPAQLESAQVVIYKKVIPHLHK